MQGYSLRYRIQRVRDLPTSRRAIGHVPYLLRFGLVGGSGVLVNYALLYLLAGGLGLNLVAASTVATEGAILSNFALNNAWTFREARSGRPLLQRGLRYNVFALGGLVLSVAVLATLTYLLGMHYLVANVFAIGTATLWNYAANYRWTWSMRSAVPFVRRDNDPTDSFDPEADNV